MEEEIDRLALKCLGDLKAAGPGSRIIIGISGVPGAGKTTLATAVAARVNKIHQGVGTVSSEANSSLSSPPIAVSLPMDGFHYSRAHLAAMPDPTEAIHRRGAAFTFDGDGFLALVQSLATAKSSAEPDVSGDSAETAGTTAATIYAPSFAHEIKDPVADAIAIPGTARIVLIEGNYCALNRQPWSDAAALMTQLWYVDAPPEVAHARLAQRHLESGIVADEKEAWERASGTDELNAKDIRENLLKVDEVIKSG